MAKRRPSGDGMVRKREDGRWEGRIVIGHKANGDSIFRYIYADTQKELTAKLRQNIDIYQGIDLTEQSRMTLSEWLDQWLEQMAVTLRPSTLEHYRKDLANHVIPYLGTKLLTQVTATDLRKLYDVLKRNGRAAVFFFFYRACGLCLRHRRRYQGIQSLSQTSCCFCHLYTTFLAITSSANCI